MFPPALAEGFHGHVPCDELPAVVSGALLAKQKVFAVGGRVACLCGVRIHVRNKAMNLHASVIYVFVCVCVCWSVSLRGNTTYDVSVRSQ